VSGVLILDARVPRGEGETAETGLIKKHCPLLEKAGSLWQGQEERESRGRDRLPNGCRYKPKHFPVFEFEFEVLV
jgi:hypothetical protein